jgi:hypothetical protein
VKNHQELHGDGTPMGRDPRTLSAADLEAMGRPRISRGDAIREKCLDCCAGAPSEVRRCGALDCALWPFRMGSDPYREASSMSEEQRAAAGERLRQAREAAAIAAR